MEDLLERLLFRPLADVITTNYKPGEMDGLRGDSKRVRALMQLMKELLESPSRKEEGKNECVEDEPVVCSADNNDNTSREACLNESWDASEAESAVWSEYTVRSTASWKERTSWFFRTGSACGKKRSVARLSCH